MTDPAIGVQLGSVNAFLKAETSADIRRSLEKVSAVGYGGVELSGNEPMKPQELKEIADGEGLKIAACHTTYEAICDNPQAIIERHRQWDCRHVAIGSPPHEYINRDGYARFAMDAPQAVRPLIDAGLTFSYHNHSFEMETTDDKTGLEVLYDESDPTVLSAEIDTYWIQHGGGNPVSWLRRLKGRMYLVHLKDMTIQNGKQVDTEVGEGNLEWPEILAACREAPVEWYIVEQEDFRRDPFESLGISLRNLRELGL